MKLLIDDANVEKMREIMGIFPIDGVTTNPAILCRCGNDMYGMLRGIRQLLGEERELHVQVIARDTEGILRDARAIRQAIPGNLFIKVPVTREGLAAIPLLKSRGYGVTATTVLNATQAFLAAKAGADYIAPYVNRIESMGTNGFEALAEMAEIYESNGFSTQILAASFKNIRQVLDMARLGIASMTIPSELFDKFLTESVVTEAVDAFTRVFEEKCGPGSNMASILRKDDISG